MNISPALLLFCVQWANADGVSQARLLVALDIVWPKNTKTIMVCFDLADNQWFDERRWVEYAVVRTWSQYIDVLVLFPAPEICRKKESEVDIWIAINDTQPHVNDAFGKDLKGRKPGVYLNFEFQKWGPSCSSNAYQPQADNRIASTSKREFCIKAIAVHEFGHIFGFYHEDTRDDTPGNKGCGGGPIIENIGIKKLGVWDLQSIMNYCNPNWDGNGFLSSGDISGARQTYSRLFLLGSAGQTCHDACRANGEIGFCDPHGLMGLSTEEAQNAFLQLGVTCKFDKVRKWWAPDQPCFVSEKSDPNDNYGKCLGINGMPMDPNYDHCSGSYPSVSRLCVCNRIAKLQSEDQLVLGPIGKNCYDTCHDHGLKCETFGGLLSRSPDQIIEANLILLIKSETNVTCFSDHRNWWAYDQPCFVADPKDGNFNRCLGFNKMPSYTAEKNHCFGSYPSVRRLCNCIS